MTDDRVRPMTIAARLGVHPVTVLRWIREGRLSAVRVGRNYFIPRVDAGVFVDAYVRYYGDPLAPKVPGRPSTHRVGRGNGHRDGNGQQSFYVTMPTAILRMVDEERRLEPERISRSDFVEAAVGHYLNVRKNARRMQGVRGRAS